MPSAAKGRSAPSLGLSFEPQPRRVLRAQPHNDLHDLVSTRPTHTHSAYRTYPAGASLQAPHDPLRAPSHNSLRSSYRVPSPEPPPLIYEVPRLITPEQRDREIARGKYPRYAQRSSGYAGNRAHSPSGLLKDMGAGSLKAARSGLDGAESFTGSGKFGEDVAARLNVGENGAVGAGMNEWRGRPLTTNEKSVRISSSIDTEEMADCSCSWKKLKILIKDWAMGTK